MTSPDAAIPIEHTLPEKPEDWAHFHLPALFAEHARAHEDKIMISRISFAKPELTLYHLRNVYKLLEDHYFTIQQLPVLHLMQLFNEEVLQDSILVEVAVLKRARLLMNLGLKTEADQLIANTFKEGGKQSYELTEEERTFNFEKIKALKDINDDIKSNKVVPFDAPDESAPLVLEQIRIHESWLELAEEQLKWGNFIIAKDLLQEVNIHARILKDQPSFAKALLHMSTIKYLEGESGQALKLDMMSHSYAQDLEFMEQAICHTFDLLFEFNKMQDASNLVEGSLEMLHAIKARYSPEAQKTRMSDPRKSQASLSAPGQPQNNLPLENAISTCYLLRATLLVTEAAQVGDTIAEQESLIRHSFDFIDRFIDEQLL